MSDCIQTTGLAWIGSLKCDLSDNYILWIPGLWKYFEEFVCHFHMIVTVAEFESPLLPSISVHSYPSAPIACIFWRWSMIISNLRICLNISFMFATRHYSWTEGDKHWGPLPRLGFMGLMYKDWTLPTYFLHDKLYILMCQNWPGLHAKRQCCLDMIHNSPTFSPVQYIQVVGKKFVQSKSDFLLQNHLLFFVSLLSWSQFQSLAFVSAYVERTHTALSLVLQSVIWWSKSIV